MVSTSVTRAARAGGVLFAVAVAFAACGSSQPSATTAASTSSFDSSATTSPVASASAAPSPTASPSPTPLDTSGNGVTLHADPALEALLPKTIGSYEMDVWSIVLTDYLNSASSQDKSLYQAWVAKLGLTSDAVTMAIAMDGTLDQKVSVLALKANGADASKIDAAFQEALQTAHWSFAHRQIGTKVVTEATDPGSGSVGDVYVAKGVVFIVLTEDPSLLTEALIRLP